jgi:hypothetical protein
VTINASSVRATSRTVVAAGLTVLLAGACTGQPRPALPASEQGRSDLISASGPLEVEVGPHALVPGHVDVGPEVVLDSFSPQRLNRIPGPARFFDRNLVGNWS